MFDVLTLGETMIRFTPKGYMRLEESSELELKIGGSESNVATALARLGLKVAWASRLPRNALGELVVRRIRSFGVDVSNVIWSGDDRMGLYFIEPGAPPRSSGVLYDRARSAASRMSPEEFDWAMLDRTRHLHVTGITPALSESAAATIGRAISEAQARGTTVSFDVNYRARLWKPEAARAALLPLVAKLDLLICPQEDAEAVFGLSGSPEDRIHGLGGLTNAPWIALTLGAGGALLWDRSEFYRAEPFPVQAVDRVGAGDAFDAGLLWGWLQGDAPKGLAYGMAMAALKHTIPGDEFVSSLAEVEALLHQGHRDIQR
jgi:2-dehydro-3-deoxygluconokinase